GSASLRPFTGYIADPPKPLQTISCSYRPRSVRRHLLLLKTHAGGRVRFTRGPGRLFASTWNRCVHGCGSPGGPRAEPPPRGLGLSSPRGGPPASPPPIDLHFRGLLSHTGLHEGCARGLAISPSGAGQPALARTSPLSIEVCARGTLSETIWW